MEPRRGPASLLAFSPGGEVVRHALASTRASGRAAFPFGLKDGAAWRAKNESAATWLQRCIAEVGDIASFAVESNLALFVTVRTSGRKGIDMEYANLQALWTSVPLDQFVDSNEHQYLRADYDPDCLGPLLKESLPHVHVVGDGEPRFPLHPAAAGDLIGWFLDFVYRNFFYETWETWAKDTWDRDCSQAGRVNTWPLLVTAFKQGKAGVIEKIPKPNEPDLREDLALLKKCLEDRRRKLFPLGPAKTRLDLFGHHCG